MVVVVVLMLVMLMFDVKKCNVERKAGCHDAGNQVV
jgi:hypothetical protein